jgi:hypothetical protein
VERSAGFFQSAVAVYYAREERQVRCGEGEPVADRIQVYIQHAQACEALLRRKLPPKEREIVAEMAAKWRTLADSRRKMLTMREKSK